jgi:Arc/MetJ family transcription regulator
VADYQGRTARGEGAKMPTRIVIDDRLILEAQELGQQRTAKEAVPAALEEYIRQRKQTDILRLFGTIKYDPSYNYKRERSRKSN